jgi:hypothetical protein
MSKYSVVKGYREYALKLRKAAAEMEHFINISTVCSASAYIDIVKRDIDLMPREDLRAVKDVLLDGILNGRIEEDEPLPVCTCGHAHKDHAKSGECRADRFGPRCECNEFKTKE